LSGSYVLDTSVLLHLVRGKDLGRQIDRAFGLRASMHRHIVSIVSEAELSVIADRKTWSSDKRSALRHALENVVVLPVDGRELIEAYVTIARADFHAPGGSRNMGKNDLWIAATAFYVQLPLLTTDKDFCFLHPAPLNVMWIDPSGNQVQQAT